MSKQWLTYGTLWQYENDPNLNLGVCISEMIDNSISSFIQNRKYLQNDELHIEVITQESFDSKKIIVIDDAYGMSKDELENCIKLNKNIELKTKTGMNQYGVGLKSAIFWIGKDARIFTKQNNKSYVLNFLPIDINQRQAGNDFDNDINKDNLNTIKTNSGTRIEIDCTKGRVNNSWTTDYDQEKCKELTKYLGKKYKNYLNGNRDITIKINIKYENLNDSRKNWNFNIEAMEFNENPLKIKELKNNNIGLNEFVEKIRLDNQKIIEENQSKKTFNYLFEKLINNEELVWEDEIFLSEEENIKIPAKFSFLSKADKNLSGLIISHNGRYINFPGKNEKAIQKTYKYCDDKKFNGYWRWLCIEIEIEKINGNEDCSKIRPDVNKTVILFSNSENFELYSEERFKESIVRYINDNLLDLFEIIVGLSKSQTEIKARDELKKSLKNNDSVVCQTNIRVDDINNLIYFKDNKNTFKITLINDENKEWIIEEDGQNPENTYNYKINKGCKLIKNNDTDSLILLLAYLHLMKIKDDNGNNLIEKESAIANVVEKIIKWKNDNNEQ